MLCSTYVLTDPTVITLAIKIVVEIGMKNMKESNLVVFTKLIAAEFSTEAVTKVLPGSRYLFLELFAIVWEIRWNLLLP